MPALAVMLGANVGTTLIVQVLSFDMTIVFPVLIAVGVFAFRRGRGTRFQDLGRVAIGLGLMLLSLHLLAEAIAPSEHSATVRDLLAALTREPLLNVAHRRGADLGGAFERRRRARRDRRSPPPACSGRRRRSPWCSAPISAAPSIRCSKGTGGDPVKLRLPLGNLATRLVGAAIALPFLGADRRMACGARAGAGPARGEFPHRLQPRRWRRSSSALLPLMARLLVRLLPAGPASDDPAKPLYLDQAALQNARRGARQRGARGAAHGRRRREDARRHAGRPSTATTATCVAETSRMDDIVDRLHEALQRYIAAIAREGAERGGGAPADRGAVLRHQPRAYRRHHRQEHHRACRRSGCG